MTALPRPGASRLPLLVTLALAAGACANPRAEQAEAARSSLVGLPKERLLACAGVPERSTRADSAEFYTYTRQQIVSYPDPVGPYWGPWGPHRLHHGFGWPDYGWPAYAGYDVRSYRCDATFTLRHGLVERVVYGGGASPGQCYDIVASCLSSTPAR